jgi:hypothetical protein
LRIPIEDFYINYIGAKAIKEAIKTMILNWYFHSIHQGYLLK